MTSPDRTDAIARALHHAANDGDCVPGYDNACDERDFTREMADRFLTTDDPAAVAAIADQWAEHHPDTLLDALTKAGVLRAEHNAVTVPCGCLVHSSAIGCGCAGEQRWGKRRLVTDWREVTP